jgi:fatty-acyl-CoA synthase
MTTEAPPRPIPDHIQDLPGALDHALDQRSGRGITFHFQEEGEVWLPLERLRASAIKRAGELIARGVEPGDKVAILGPNSPHWIEWAFATWMAGAAIVPLGYPLRVRDRVAFAEQIRSLMDAAKCKLAVAPANFLPAIPEDQGILWTFEPDKSPASLPGGKPEPNDAAVIQFTSGSTAFPKGVVISHRAAIEAIRFAHHGFGDYDPANSRQVSWLPFFHDWGLFGQIVRPIVGGNEVDILPTEAFARAPGRWFRLATWRQARYLEAPPTAMAAAVQAVIRNPQGVDLSNVVGVAMAAEPVSAEVIELLREAGKILKLDPDTLHVAYGMAELCMAVTINHWDQPLRIDDIDMEEFAQGRAVPATGSGPVKRVVSCGSPGGGTDTSPGSKIRIVEPGTAEDLPDREVGEVLAWSPAMMDGYLDVPLERQPFIDGWLQTGDTGYMADGELFITGRIKDIVIVYGRNYAPEDFEWAAERVPGVRIGRTVAFARPDGAEGEIVIAVEPAGATEPARLPRRIRQAVSDAVGLMAREVLVLPKGAIPKTTSGKVRRSALRDQYASGALVKTALATLETATSD